MQYKLLKDLPNCPKGAILKPTANGGAFKVVLADDESSVTPYKFPKVDIMNNPHWFEAIKE